MAGLGALKKLKKLGQKVINGVKKVGGFIRDVGIDIALKGIKFVKSGQADLFVNLISTFVPGGGIAREIYDKVKMVLNHFDEDKVGEALKLALKGDFSHLNDLVSSIKSTGSFVKDNINQLKPSRGEKLADMSFTRDEEGNIIPTYDRYFGNKIN